MPKNKSENIDFKRLTIRDVEDLVGRKPHDIEVHKNSIICHFDNNMRWIIKNWK